MVDHILLSPQVKQSIITSNKHGICELPHELPNNLRLRILQNIRKVSKLHRMIASCLAPLPKNFFVSTNTKVPKNSD